MEIANQNRNCPRQKVDHVLNEQKVASVQQQAQNAALLRFMADIQKQKQDQTKLELFQNSEKERFFTHQN